MVIKYFKENGTKNVYKVNVLHKQNGFKSLTGTSKVYFGKINNKGTTYAFKVPTKYKLIKKPKQK